MVVYHSVYANHAHQLRRRMITRRVKVEIHVITGVLNPVFHFTSAHVSRRMRLN